MTFPETLVTHEPMNEYAASRGEYLTSHALLDFMKCPLLYFKKSRGIIPDEDSTSYLIGRAAHARILEGLKAYFSSYAIGGPVNPKTGRPFGSATRTFAEWAAGQGRPVLTTEQDDLVQDMNFAVESHGLALRLLSRGTAEGVVRAAYCGVPCQIRIDWLSPEYGIVDLKTCDDLTWFDNDARRFRYINQMAFYRAVLASRIRCSSNDIPVRIIAVEKKEPFRCGVWRLDGATQESSINWAERENASAIERWQHCRDADEWPTGYEEERLLVG